MDECRSVGTTQGIVGQSASLPPAVPATWPVLREGGGF